MSTWHIEWAARPAAELDGCEAMVWQLQKMAGMEAALAVDTAWQRAAERKMMFWVLGLSRSALKGFPREEHGGRNGEDDVGVSMGFGNAEHDLANRLIRQILRRKFRYEQVAEKTPGDLRGYLLVALKNLARTDWRSRMAHDPDLKAASIERKVKSARLEEGAMPIVEAHSVAIPAAPEDLSEIASDVSFFTAYIEQRVRTIVEHVGKEEVLLFVLEEFVEPCAAAETRADARANVRTALEGLARLRLELIDMDHLTQEALQAKGEVAESDSRGFRTARSTLQRTQSRARDKLAAWLVSDWVLLGQPGDREVRSLAVEEILAFFRFRASGSGKKE